MITSHYAEPLERRIVTATALHAGPSEQLPVLAQLAPGDSLAMLDCTAGWAWGYAGAERRVGYVRAEAVGRD